MRALSLIYEAFKRLQGGKKTKGSQLNKAGLSQALTANVRERKERRGTEREFMINFHFLCLIIPCPNEISEEEINLPAVPAFCAPNVQE